MFKFSKNQIGYDVIVTSFKFFLQTIVHISNSIEPRNFVLGTYTQQHYVHLEIKMKVTLADDEGHRRRSKVIKNELMTISRKLLHSQTLYLVPRYKTISDIFLTLTEGQGHNSRSKVTDVEVSAFSECFLFFFFICRSSDIKPVCLSDKQICKYTYR